MEIVETIRNRIKKKKYSLVRLFDKIDKDNSSELGFDEIYFFL